MVFTTQIHLKLIEGTQFQKKDWSLVYAAKQWLLLQDHVWLHNAHDDKGANRY
jgi:hypothetical protein